MKINTNITPELYQALKKLVNAFDEAELFDAKQNGWSDEMPKLESERTKANKNNSWWREYYGHDYYELKLRVISHKDLPENRLEIKMVVIDGSEELNGKILVYNVYKTNKHMLKSFYDIDEKIETYLITLEGLKYDEKQLLSGKSIYKPHNEINILRLYVNKPGKQESSE